MGSGLKLRAFLALPLASSFQVEVTPLVERLKRECPWIRWVSPSEIHVTLHFFGSIGREAVSKISSSVTPVTDRTKPFNLFLQNLGAFPSWNRARVIWVGLGGEVEALRALQHSLEGCFRKSGFPCEERSFKAHLTLGRIREPRALPGWQDFAFGPTPARAAREIVLFQSQLSPEGTHYEALAAYPLAET